MNHNDKEYQRQYREANRERLNANNRRYQAKQRFERKEQLYDLKTPCAKCGESRAHVIDFHHINPEEKRFNISTRATHYSVNTVREEVKKCVCLCRNCHIEFHHLYGNKPKHPVEDLKEYLGENVSWEFTSKKDCGKRIVELLGGV